METDVPRRDAGRQGSAARLEGMDMCARFSDAGRRVRQTRSLPRWHVIRLGSNRFSGALLRN